MQLIHEIQGGDTFQRAGVVITEGNLILCGQPTNMIKNNWKLDIFKGHIQHNESIIHAAIRECWEESGILFEPWKLTRPIQTTCGDDPLFLFYAKIDQLIPVNLLSCASTFVDEDGIRKPEVEAYYWINPYTQLHLMQERLIPGIKYYFNNQKYLEASDEFSEMEKDLEDCCQTTGGIMGSVPPNIKQVLSLGYKNGGVLSSPKAINKRA
jgi:8-oxo-dGTP pyrophosphatase MutT (NUDIX family)